MEQFLKFKNRIKPENLTLVEVTAAKVEKAASKIKDAKMNNEKQFAMYYRALFEKILKTNVYEISMDEEKQMWYCKIYKKK